MTSISTLTERRIDDFYLDLRDYVAHVFDGAPEEVSLDWNCVGATLSYRDDTHNIFIRLWERSEGHLNLPDMTMIVETVIFDRKLGTRHYPDTTNHLCKEMNAFSKCLILTARICGLAPVKPSPCFAVKYVTDPNIPPIPDENGPGCPIACLPPEIVPTNPSHATPTSPLAVVAFISIRVISALNLRLAIKGELVDKISYLHKLLVTLHNKVTNMTKLNRIKVVLVEKGQTQTWLAEKIGKSFNTVNAYCSNRQQPTLNVLQDIAQVLEVDIRDLLIPKENLNRDEASR